MTTRFGFGRPVVLPFLLLSCVLSLGAGTFTQGTVCNGVISPSCTTTSGNFSESAVALGPATLTANSFAFAAYGVLRAEADMTLTNGQTASQIYGTSAHASFSDVLTIGGGSGAGFLVVSITVSGSTSASGPASAGGGLSVGDGHANEMRGISGPGTFTFAPIGFTFGTPFTLSVDLGAGATSMVTGGAPYDAMAMADFSHTAVLTGLLVQDALGALVADAVFRSDSGTAYTQNGVVPEPSTGVLLALGAGLAGLRIFLKRRV